jgi:VanZ like family
MDDHRYRAAGPATTAHPGGPLVLAAALLVVGALTLTPAGTGWTWGAPLAELRWYATGLDSETTVLQLIGNLCLLAVPAGLVVALWPSAGRTGYLVALAVGAAAGIEVLQWLLPLGRVVSPLDAALNAAGAVAAGLLVRAAIRRA